MRPANQTLTTIDLAAFQGLPVYAQVPGGWTDHGHQPQRSPAGFTNLLEIPFRHTKLILFFMLLGALAGWLAIVFWPRSYQSEARMLIKVGRESVGLDPTATTGTTLMLQRTREEEVVSALEILESRRIAEVVVDSLGPDVVLGGELPDVAKTRPRACQGTPPDRGPFDQYVGSTLSAIETMKSSLSAALLRAGIKDEIGKRELAIQRLQSSVYIHAPERTTVICVEALAGSPAVAQKIVSKVVEAFQEEHLNAAYTAGSLDFFQQQSADKERILDQVKKNRSDYMRKHNIVSIEANRLMLQEQLSGINRDLVVAYGDLQQAVASAHDLVAKEADEPQEITASKLESKDPTWASMREMIYELEIEEERAKAIYSDPHPALKKVQKQLAGARTIFESQTEDRVDTSKTPNPEKVRLGAALQAQQTIIAGLESEIAAKQLNREQLLLEIDELLSHESYLDVLDRDILQADTDLRSLRTSLEEARVNNQLHQKKISNVSVFQPATFVEQAASPNKRLLALGFLLLGLTSGLGLAAVKEASSKTLRTSEDIKAELDCSNVTTIPWVQSKNPIGRRFSAEFSQQCQSLISDALLAKPASSDTGGRTIGVLGVDVGVGASTLAVHLATASKSKCNLPTLLIDADFRHRSISKIFGLQGTPGLVELVGGVASHDECIQRPRNSSVDLVASVGDLDSKQLLTADPAEIVQAIDTFKVDTELLIVDLPAASQPDQAVALARHLDYVIVVVESEATKTQDAQRLIHRLSKCDTEVLGVVLNKSKCYLPRAMRKLVSL